MKKDNLLYVFCSERACFPFSYDAGSERTIYAIISGLVKKGISIVQLTLLPEKGISKEVESICTDLDFEIHTYSPEAQQDFFNIKPTEKWLLLKRSSISIIALTKKDYYGTGYQLLKNLKPDLLLTYLRGSAEFIEYGHQLNIPTVHRIFGVGSYNFPDLSGEVRLMANSPMSARSSQAIYNYYPEYIYSIVDFEKYKTERKHPKYVTYINPRAKKGLHFFCRLVASLPHIPFLVIEGWGGIFNEEEEKAMDFLRRSPNVKAIPAVFDIKKVYDETKILIVPSRLEESFGRVVIEAQISGIPVIGSDRGNLPDTISTGGKALTYGAVELWVDNINELYTNEDLLQKMEIKARENTKRFEPAILMEQYHTFLLETAMGNAVHSISRQQQSA